MGAHRARRAVAAGRDGGGGGGSARVLRGLVPGGVPQPAGGAVPARRGLGRGAGGRDRDRLAAGLGGVGLRLGAGVRVRGRPRDRAAGLPAGEDGRHGRQRDADPRGGRAVGDPERGDGVHAAHRRRGGAADLHVPVRRLQHGELGAPGVGAALPVAGGRRRRAARARAERAATRRGAGGAARRRRHAHEARGARRGLAGRGDGGRGRGHHRLRGADRAARRAAAVRLRLPPGAAAGGAVRRLVPDRRRPVRAHDAGPAGGAGRGADGAAGGPFFLWLLRTRRMAGM